MLELVRLPFVRLPADDGGEWVCAAAEARRYGGYYGLLSPALLERARQLLQRNWGRPDSLLGSSPFYTMRLYPGLPAGFRSKQAGGGAGEGEVMGRGC